MLIPASPPGENLPIVEFVIFGVEQTGTAPRRIRTRCASFACHTPAPISRWATGEEGRWTAAVSCGRSVSRTDGIPSVKRICVMWPVLRSEEVEQVAHNGFLRCEGEDWGRERQGWPRASCL